MFAETTSMNSRFSQSIAYGVLDIGKPQKIFFGRAVPKALTPRGHMAA